ncbi:hypothetical protein TELCIR_22041 [Teladorsagia circumcincta]|uniref:Serpin domain-containing protein n=1 Tax=Teladorsagia circumcincta TaxID=45464 RepID=A0A2G9TF08_TELCI|nr:hypothetical protein TELCIR_22041 [Teladorsagia circumcincta]
MKHMLQKLGVTELFSSDACDLKGVSPDELYVGDVVHQAVIEVDEEGGEPDAVAQEISKRMFTLRNIFPIFRADRPFLYGIFHNHELVLIGQYC